jgi:hypothetical protein
MTCQLLITVALFVAMLVSPWAGTVMAQTTGNVQTGTNSVTGTSEATNTNSASQVVYYSKKQVLADGGTRYTFIIGGVENVLHVPPVGFDPATATDAQLAEYGYPARPKDQTGLTGWQNKWGRFKPKTSSAEPTITIMKKSINDSSGSGWAGYADYYAGQTTKFGTVDGYYNQPSYNTGSPSDAREASWVGLGGYNTSSLIQAGTEMDAPTPTYYGWYLYMDASGSTTGHPSTIVVHPGDSMYAMVYWTTSNWPAGFEVWDWTTMTDFYVTAQAPSDCYNGQSAEFIDERPQVVGQKNDYFPVAGFNTPITWTDCEVQYPNNDNGVNFGTLLTVKQVMTGGTGYPLVTPGSINSTYNGFTDTWSAGHYQ